MIKFEDWLNEITRRWVLDEKIEAQFVFLGVSPTLWPHCNARTILLRYLDFKDKFNSVVAGRAEALAAGALALPECELPSDDDLFLFEYNKLLNIHRYRTLATKLNATPDQGENLIKQFLSESASGIEMSNLALVLNKLQLANEERAKKNENLVLLKGFEKLSTGIGGFNMQRVSMLVAGTGIGKTTVAINLALAANRSGMQVLFLNQEMGFDDFGARIIECGTGMTHQSYLSGVIDYTAFGNFFNLVNESKDFYFTHGKSLSLEEITATILNHSDPEKRTFVIIDYDQKIVSNGYDEEWRMLQKAVEKLENVSKHTNSHIMMLSQGDDAGDPKASKRSKQAAATVVQFGKNEEQLFFIRAHKNRFGVKDFAVEINYDPSRALATEGRVLRIDEIKPKQKDTFPWVR